MDSDRVVLKNEALMETSDLLRIALHKKISRNAPASAIERLSDAIIRVEEARAMSLVDQRARWGTDASI